MRDKNLVITIDGPAGSGKSTVAGRLARVIGFRYLDTGAIYRAFTLKALQQGLDSLRQKGLIRLVKTSRIKFTLRKGRQRIILDNQDVTREIRDPWVTTNVYRLAELPRVRKAMVKKQRAFGKNGNLVAEGRDLGSVVFPDAFIKFYLDASLKERARRRHKELVKTRHGVVPPRESGSRTGRKGRLAKYSTVLNEIRNRDRRDTSRRVAPLKRVKDAVYVDTTSLSIRQVVQKLVEIVNVIRWMKFSGLKNRD